MRTFKDYLQVKAAAEFLGVSTGTLRNWDRAGKVQSFRNPVNGYRLFKKSSLEALLKSIEQRDRQQASQTPAHPGKHVNHD